MAPFCLSANPPFLYGIYASFLVEPSIPQHIPSCPDLFDRFDAAHTLEPTPLQQCNEPIEVALQQIPS